MKTKGLVLVSCLAAAALTTSPALGEMQKKSRGAKPQRMAPRTAQVMPTSRHGNISSYAAPRHYAGNQRYTATRQYAGNTQFVRGRQYTGARYYGRSGYATNGYYGNSGYYGGPSYYYGGGWGYPYSGYYSGWPYGSYSYYPYSYYGGYPYSYSYYGGGYAYGTGTVAAVQRRLGEFGFYDGVVDGVMGPRTRAAIAAFESTHGMVVDGVISGRLLNRMGLA